MTTTAIRLPEPVFPPEEGRVFAPGTMGWTVADLEDPLFARLWFAGRYEIVEGVLTQMPAAYFAGQEALYNLMRVVEDHAVAELGVRPRIAMEVEVVVNLRRLARSDAAMLLPADSKRQTAAARKAGKTDPARTLIYVPPTLIVESLSPGHEDHDLHTKRRWYAEFGVPHYWMLDAVRKELHCLRLLHERYINDAEGHGKQVVRPSLFPGLTIPLKRVWAAG
jgi:hypothetical protein